MEPIQYDAYWECPKCHWKNPYSNMTILTYPPTTCYKCNNCDYHYDYRAELSAEEKFRINNPNGCQ